MLTPGVCRAGRRGAAPIAAPPGTGRRRIAPYDLAVDAGTDPPPDSRPGGSSGPSRAATGRALVTGAGRAGAAVGSLLLAILQDGVARRWRSGLAAGAAVTGLVTTIVLATRSRRLRFDDPGAGAPRDPVPVHDAVNL